MALGLGISKTLRTWSQRFCPAMIRIEHGRLNSPNCPKLNYWSQGDSPISDFQLTERR